MEARADLLNISRIIDSMTMPMPSMVVAPSQLVNLTPPDFNVQPPAMSPTQIQFPKPPEKTEPVEFSSFDWL